MPDDTPLEPRIAKIIAIGASVILARRHPEYGVIFFGEPQNITDIPKPAEIEDTRSLDE